MIAVARRLRGPIGIALAIIGACLVSWGAFVFARGAPGECGGDAPPCPPGTTSGALGLLAGVVVLLPLSAVLGGRRRPETTPAVVALAAVGAAAGIFCSRFVADPITDATATTWWVTAILVAIAALAAVTALALPRWRQPPPAPPRPAAPARRADP